MATQTPGNSQPKIVANPSDDPLLKSIRVPDGWSVSVFATLAGAGIPHSIKSTPEGELFVSLDGGAADGGRVLKLIDTDRDGSADEFHEFIPQLDSPRGLEWDGEWLYVMHPPYLSAVRDTDGDHIADEDRELVKGLTNGTGATLGIDGWLYLAIGDSGFFQAEGSDGATLQLRGGGVVRVRPDGSGLHLYSKGVRGISEVAVSPSLDVFARGTANEDIGWDAGLHQFTGLDHHGYPERFRSFGEDIVPPLAEYGAGPGAVTLFLGSRFSPGKHSPGPLMIAPDDNMIYRHELELNDSTWRETARHEFISVPRPVDIDVDGLSRLYIASGGEEGVVARVIPPDSKQVRRLRNSIHGWLQEFPDADLSHPGIQQAVLRSGLPEESLAGLEQAAIDSTLNLDHRIGALFLMKLAFGGKANPRIVALGDDPELLPFAIRALGDFPDQKSDLDPSIVSKALSSKDLRTRREAVFAISRLKLTGFEFELAKLAVSADPVIAHMSINALAELRRVDECFEILDDFGNYEVWPGVFRALARIHEMRVVEGLISRLEKTDSSLFRSGAIKTLARLYHRESEWNGKNWGPRPDTRGPCVAPVTWKGTDPIGAVLRKALRDKRVNKTFLFGELGRNRIPFDDFKTLLSMTAVTPELEEPTVSLILEQKKPPPDSLPFLTFIATSEDRAGDLRLGAAIALARAPNDMAATSAFRLTLEREKIDGVPQLRDSLKETLLKNAYHENRYDWLLEEAHGLEENAGTLAWTILLQLTQLANLAPAPRREIENAIERADLTPAILRRLLLAIADLEFSPQKERVTNAIDHPDESVSEAARKAAAALKRPPVPEDPAETR